MCGIAGAYGMAIDNSWVEEQLVILSRRGPDSQGSFAASSNCHLASCRLAMTDPMPRSNQPFVDIYSGNSIVFNGEIYNFHDLKDKLLLEFPTENFHTQSDTEVLLRWLDKHGERGVPCLQGMFSFAYFNKSANKLSLCRDSLGKKPLYWAMYNKSIYWSSSLESFKSLLTPLIDHDAIVQYFSLGYILDPTSIFRNVQSILPGQNIEFVIYQNEVKMLSNRNVKPLLSYSHSLRETIESAVNRRIEGHEKIAISLSGGVDSSIISLHLKDSSKKVTSFSCIWTDSDKDKYNKDAVYAARIAENLGLNHFQVEMPKTNQIDEYLSRYLIAMQEPNANPTGISLYALYEEIAQQGFRLVLTGDGSDEIFAGYQRYRELQKTSLGLKLKSEFLRMKLVEFNGRLGRGISRSVVSLMNQEFPETWFYWHGIFFKNELKNLFQNPKTAEAFDSKVLTRISEISPTHSQIHSVSTLMERDRMIWLDMESNRKLDRISMFFSIEARSPFQDERVTSVALSKRDQIVRESGTKNLLWKSYPELETLGVRRDKEGFISPVGHWLRNNQKLVEHSIRILINEKVFVSSVLNSYKYAAFESDFRRIKQLWHLVALAKWLEVNSLIGKT
jgi:asparagine synthase (glutamine-hydrolysing)